MTFRWVPRDTRAAATIRFDRLRRLQHLLGMNSYDRLRDAHRTWVEGLLTKMNGRERVWTESIAVGSKCFVEQTKTNLGFKAIGRSPREANGVYEL